MSELGWVSPLHNYTDYPLLVSPMPEHVGRPGADAASVLALRESDGPDASP
jgi:hypothetical protein